MDRKRAEELSRQAEDAFRRKREIMEAERSARAERLRTTPPTDDDFKRLDALVARVADQGGTSHTDLQDHYGPGVLNAARQKGFRVDQVQDRGPSDALGTFNRISWKTGK